MFRGATFQDRRSARHPRAVLRPFPWWTARAGPGALRREGEKTFAAEFAIVYDRQSYPQVIVEDVSGGTAYSTPKWLFRYHAGLMRCGDNSNLLSQSPNLVFFANWNNCWCEFARYRYLPERHYHISEASLWDRELAQPTREAMSSCHAQWCDLRIKDSPILPHERVSNFTTFPLVEPGVVTILDQIQGEKLMERSAYGKRHTYAQARWDRVTRESRRSCTSAASIISWTASTLVARKSTVRLFRLRAVIRSSRRDLLSEGDDACVRHRTC